MDNRLDVTTIMACGHRLRTLPGGNSHPGCPRIRFPCRHPHFLDSGPTKYCKDRFHAVLKWRRLELLLSEPHGGADLCPLLTRLYVSLPLIKPSHPNPHPSLRRSITLAS